MNTTKPTLYVEAVKDDTGAVIAARIAFEPSDGATPFVPASQLDALREELAAATKEQKKWEELALRACAVRDEATADRDALAKQVETLTEERDEAQLTGRIANQHLGDLMRERAEVAALTADRDEWKRKALMDPTGLSSLLYRDQYKELSEVNFKHMQERDAWKEKAEAAERGLVREKEQHSHDLRCMDLVRDAVNEVTGRKILGCSVGDLATQHAKAVRGVAADRDAARARVADLEAAAKTDQMIRAALEAALRPMLSAWDGNEHVPFYGNGTAAQGIRDALSGGTSALAAHDAALREEIAREVEAWFARALTAEETHGEQVNLKDVRADVLATIRAKGA